MTPEMLTGDNDADNEADYVGGVIKRVSNFNPRSYKRSLAERKKFQKTIYLIQAFDIPLGYSFNWYLHGPYSPDLAEVGYALADIYDHVDEARFQEMETEQQFQSFLDYVGPIKEDVLGLEAAASLHFIAIRNPEAGKDPVIEFVIDEKDLRDEEREIDGIGVCEREWARLDEHGVLP